MVSEMGIMMFGVLRMPYEMAMSDELSRRQYWDRAQEATNEIESIRARVAELEAMMAKGEPVAWVGRIEDGAMLMMSMPDDWVATPLYEHPTPTPEDVLFASIELARMIMSDCGLSSTNNESLAERIAGRIDKYTNQSTPEDVRDAERYRFLRDTKESSAELVTAFDLLNKWESPSDEVDAAIDAAMMESKHE